MKQFKPLGDRVLIKPIKQEETKTKVVLLYPNQ